MTSPHDGNWRTLSERLLCGERLSADEEDELVLARERESECAIELDLLEELAAVLDRSDERADPVNVEIARAAVARAREIPAEEAVSSRRHGAGRRWAVAAIGVAAASAAIWWSTRPAAPDPARDAIASARLVLSTGDVYVDGAPASADRLELSADATIAVQNGQACFAIDGGVDVCLDANTTAMLHGLDDAAPWVEVRRGRAAARLDPQRPGRSFALGAAHMHATAVGTIFALSVDSPSRTLASVLHGVVDVSVAGETLRLSAQEAAWIDGGVVERGPLSASDEAVALRLLAPLQRLDPAGGGHLAVVASPTGASVRVDGIEVGSSPVLLTLSAGEHRIEIADGGGARVGESVRIVAGQVVERHFDLPAVHRTADPAQSPPAMSDTQSEGTAAPDIAADGEPGRAAEASTDGPARAHASTRARPVASAAQMLTDARELRRADRWHDAARAYRSLVKAHPRSPEAETAWVSLGDLQLDRLGQPSAAAKSYGHYLATGAVLLAAEARYGRVRAYRNLGDRTREIGAIETYLEHHGATVRARALRERLTQLRGAGP